MANLAVTPEIGHFRSTGKIRRLLVAFVVVQIALGTIVGVQFIGKIINLEREVWGPSGFKLGQSANEFFKMAIGVSESGNFLPTLAWIVGFHGVFLSALTGVSLIVIVPSTGLMILNFLWTGDQPIATFSLFFVFLVIISLGLEGLNSSARRARLKGIPSTVFAGRGRELLVLSVAILLVAPLVPDVRRLTKFENIWDLEGGEPHSPRGVLRFSTIYQFAGNVRPDVSPAFLVETEIPLYWRGLTFDRYTGREFLLENLTPTWYSPGETLPSSYQDVANYSSEVSQNYTLLGLFPSVLFAAFEPRVLKGIPYGLTDSNVLLARRPNEEGGRYEAVSNVVKPEPNILRMKEMPPDPDPRYLDLPETLPPRVGELALNWTNGLESPFDMAVAIAQRLKTLRYSLGIGPTPVGRDVVDYFLFDSQAGYCQHFAAAMVVLCRELGIPARIATGFGSGTYDTVKRAYKVLQLNYHAWVEVQFEGFGWVSFDPTNGGIGGPEVLDAAEANVIFDGTLPYYGEIERTPTSIYLTRTPEYISGDQTFFLEGRVLRQVPETKGAALVPLNVSINVSGINLFPIIITPKETLSILITDSRTDSEGYFLALCALPSGVSEVTTEVSVKVSCLGNDLNEPSSTWVTIPIRSRASIEVEIIERENITILATLKGPGGSMPEQELEILIDGRSIGIYTTNGSGMVCLLTKPDPGSHVLVTRYQGNGSIGSASTVLNFDVKLPGTADNGKGHGLFLIFLPISVVSLLGMAYLYLRRRKARRIPKTIDELYRRMLDVYSKAGFSRHGSMTPYEFLTWLDQRGADGYREARTITESFVKARYAGIRAEPEILSEERRDLEEISQALARQRSTFMEIRLWLSSVISDLLPWRA
jgi:transglutaminase-like putative cysteine protease